MTGFGWLLRLWRLLYATWLLSGRKQTSLIAAGVAFFGMFAVFPAIAAVIALFGLVADPAVVGTQLELLQNIIPEDAYSLFSSQINRLLRAQTHTLGWATFVSIVLALWSSRAGVAALMGGLDAIAGGMPRNGIWHAVVAFWLTICLVSLAIVALFAVVVTPIILAFLPIAASTAWMLEALRWLIALTSLLLALGLLYRFGPARGEGRIRCFTVGAVAVVILWVAASVGLSYYLTNFGAYNEVYGSIGAVIGLMLWLYVSAYLVLLGAALNEQVHRNTAGKSSA